VKRLMVEETAGRYRDMAGMVAITYSGIAAGDADAVRSELLAKNVRLRVVKNSVTRVAMEQLGHPEFGKLLDGPVAIVSSSDPLAASRAAVAIAKERNLQVKGGWAEGKDLAAADVVKLALLPSREALLAKLAGCIAGPARSLASLLVAPCASLARAVKAWNEKREGARAGQDSVAGAGG